MSSVRIGKIVQNFKLTLFLILLLIVFYIFSQSLIKQEIYSKRSNKIEETKGDEVLLCEKVWRNVLNSRKKKFNSRINPAHIVIDELLEIVSENKTICERVKSSNNSSVKSLVILVNSARSHFNERQLIRESWGSLKVYSENWQIITVFLLGQSDYCLNGESRTKKWATKESKKWEMAKEEELNLENEQKENGDLVLGSFTDTYRNLTYKHLMGYKFVLESCPRADFIVKTDDDAFVNIPRILDTRGKGETTDMICFKHVAPPNRMRKGEGSKWFLTEDEWSTDKLPEFCIGEMFGVTRNWMENFYGVRNMGGFLWIDDAFVTGKLREVAEREFGKKVRLFEIKEPELVWYYVDKRFCKEAASSSLENLRKKKKSLPMYAVFSRDDNFKWSIKCLSDISMGKNVSINF